jgi:uncharacterized MAPEG superfamily protein
MPLAIWCVLAAGILPILTAGVAKRGDRTFDNSKPRDWEATLQGWRKRVYAAHRNGLESFPFFAAAVLSAWTQGASQNWVDGLAVAYVVSRLLYVWAYASDRPSLRSALFGIGFLIAIAIFIAPLWASGVRDA